MVLVGSGAYRVEYEDVLRAIGNYLDANQFRYITVVETPDGFLIKGLRLASGQLTTVLNPETYLFTNDDVEIVLEQALARRGSGIVDEDALLSKSLRYENALRVIGRQLDNEKLHDIVIVQGEQEMRIKALVRQDASARDAGHILERRLTNLDLDKLVDAMRAERRPNESSWKSRWPF